MEGYKQSKARSRREEKRICEHQSGCNDMRAKGAREKRKPCAQRRESMRAKAGSERKGKLKKKKKNKTGRKTTTRKKKTPSTLCLHFHGK
jgi:hypothetical protein